MMFIESLVLEVNIDFAFRFDTRELDRLKLIARSRRLKDAGSYKSVSTENSVYLILTYASKV